MARIQQVLRMATAFALGGGCTAQVDDPTVADDEAVLDHVEALGFERSEARVLTDRVVADGDIIFNRESLLRGEYERWESVDDAGLVEKGYRYPGRVAEKHRGNIKLLFATGRFAPTKEIRSAFLEAAKAWSKIPAARFEFRRIARALRSS